MIIINNDNNKVHNDGYESNIWSILEDIFYNKCMYSSSSAPDVVRS